MSVEKTTPSRTVLSRRRHAAGRRARILKEGGRRIDLLLEHDISGDLEFLERADGDDATTVISKLIRRSAAAKRRKA